MAKDEKLKAPSKPNVTMRVLRGRVAVLENQLKSVGMLLKVLTLLALVFVVLSYFAWNVVQQEIEVVSNFASGNIAILQNDAIENNKMIANWSQQFTDGVIRILNAQTILLANTTGRIIVVEEELGIKLVGGQVDDRGCLVAAGYSWCESTQKCQRFWENKC